MTMKITALAALGAVFATAPAYAQTAAPVAAAPQVQHGPNIPGLCVLSQQGAIGSSVVGKFVVERVRQLEAQTRAELVAMKATLDKDVQSFETARATLSAEAVTQQGTALNDRFAKFEQLVQTRARESEATQNKALARISQEMSPLVTQTYQARGCSILIDEGAVLAGAPSVDITPDVIRLLDAKITQFPVEWERDVAAAAVAPAISAPAPAAARAAPARR